MRHWYQYSSNAFSTFLERRVHDFDAAIDKLAAGDLRSEGASRAKDPQHLSPFTLHPPDCLGLGVSRMIVRYSMVLQYMLCFALVFT